MDGVVQEREREPHPAPPGTSRVLRPGAYLVELSLQRPISRQKLEQGLSALGFSGVVLDQEPADETSRLFVADLHRSILCTDTPLVTWRTANPIGVDLHADLREKTVPFRLLEGRAYEMLLIARLKAFPNRDVFEQCMSSMGFRLEHAIALKKDMRVRGKPNASATLWYCVGTWNRSNSYIVDCDPFYFESVQERPTPKEEGT